MGSWKSHALGPCACSQVRRSARAISSLYDAALAPVGLTVTQYAILVRIGREPDGISRTGLAALLGMDRTTLTRNLRPLEAARLAVSKADAADRRASILRLTPAGQRKLDAAFSLWATAQRRFVETLGAGRWGRLNGLLADAATAAADVTADVAADESS